MSGNDENSSVDAGFRLAVIRAGRAFVEAKNADPTIEGKELAEYLASDSPLGRGEREMLADLVIGAWRKPTGRRQVTAGQRHVEDVVTTLREKVKEGWKKEAAKKFAMEKHKIKSKATVEKYEKMIIQREKLLKEAADSSFAQTNR